MFLLIDNSEAARGLLPLCMLTAGEDFAQPPVRRPNGAPLHQIFFIERGSIRVRCDKGELLLGQGSAAFMQKGYPVFYEPTDAETRVGWVSFDGSGVEPLLRYFHAEPFSHVADAPLRDLRRACMRAAEHKAPSEQLSALTYELLLAYFQALNRTEASSALDAAKAFMEQHYAADLSVDDVAAAAGISPSLLYRLFSREGTTPVGYLRALRLSCAKQLLLSHLQMPVSAIAATCGFADTAYFCKVFRDAERMTPRAYRAMYTS
jgi:AraC-like DNA-binding protein